MSDDLKARAESAIKVATACGNLTDSPRNATRVMVDLLARINELEAMVTWRPISEAPRDGTWVLLTEGRGDPVAIGFWNGRAWDDGDDHDEMDHFQWWAPLLSTASLKEGE